MIMRMPMIMRQKNAMYSATVSFLPYPVAVLVRNSEFNLRFFLASHNLYLLQKEEFISNYYFTSAL